MSDPHTLPSQVEETRNAWDQIAPVWDDYMGEGGSFQRHLVGPATERLLAVQAGQRVLDVACGNGLFSRRLAQLGASVVACDLSAVFIERAQARTVEHTDRITYHVVDATDQAALVALGVGQFDAALCSMALHDMPTVEPLALALAQLLKPGAAFVFSVPHPCFNELGVQKVVEQVEQAGDLVTSYAVKVTRYIEPTSALGLGFHLQPVPHRNFHRPLSLLLAPFFRVGLALDGLEEPVFDPDAVGRGPFSWENYREIPPVLVARLRRPAA